MSKFQVATEFFHACESLKGAEGCADFISNDASFDAQSEPVADITRLSDYCDWMMNVGKGPLAGCRYELQASCFDEASATALFFAVFHATHSGEGGPVDPTGKTTASHYVYAVKVGDDNKVHHLTKIWNAPWALRELGWGE